MDIGRQRLLPAWFLHGPSVGMKWMLVKLKHLWTVRQEPTEVYTNQFIKGFDGKQTH